LVARSPHTLASARLTLASAPAGSVWHHIFLDRFPDPLGFGFASSRFSDPRKSPRFGVYYVGQTFEVAFLETIVRDRRNGNPGPLILSASDLDAYVHVLVTAAGALNLLDLRGGNAIAMGVPTNAVRASSHRRGQRASVAAHDRPERLDGIWYPSRLNDDENLAIYGRSIGKLSAGPRRTLTTCPEMAPILNIYHVALV
jgi:hypothetical protein